MARNLIHTTLNNRYRFDDIIGEGTFARVYRVHDLKRNVDLAAKVLREDIALEPTFIQRFKREAEVLARLQHPNIVRYYETVETDGLVFILLDYIPADNLQSYIYKLGTTFTIPHVLQFIRPLTAALTYAHGEGVIHRDIKPANILLGNNGQVYITDFGIARIINEASTLTQDSSLGTPLYMSPEQLLGGQITLATDIYAVGVLLYQMLTGTPPFVGKSESAKGTTIPEKVAYEHLNIPPRPPRELNPNLDQAVDDVVLRCLRKEATVRFPSALAIYDALAETIGATPATLEPVELTQKPQPPQKTLPEWSKVVPKAPDPTTPNQAIEPSTAQTMVHMEDVEPEPIAVPQPYYLPPPVYANTQPYPAWQTQAPPQRYQYRQLSSRYNTWLIGLIIVMVFIVLALAVVSGILIWDMLSASSTTISPSPTISRELITDTFSSPTPLATNEISNNTVTLPPADPALKFIYSNNSNGSFDIYEMNLTSRQSVKLRGDSIQEMGAAYSPDGTQIAYYGYTNNNAADIWLMDVDGSNAQNLTNSNADERVVAWSPDGTKLTFHSDADGRYDIFIYDLASQTSRNITQSSHDDLGPAWSPDGEWIAFHSDEDGGFNEIFMIRTDGTDRQQVTDGQWNAAFPAWHPDQDLLGFHSIIGANTYSLGTVSISSDDSYTNLIDGDNQRHLDWSSDGSSILYMAGSLYDPSIFVYDLISNEAVELAHGYYPDWKPD